MSFKILKEIRNGIDFLILKNESNGEYAEIIPDKGATVNKLYLLFNDSVSNILYCDSDDEILDNPLFRGRILFPFNDAIPDGAYTYNEIPYTVDINEPNENLAIHGYVYNKKFDIISEECAEDACSVTLQYALTREQMKGYPFDVTLAVTYVLKAREFDVRFEIINSGSQTAPLTFGWHPYFTFDGSIDQAILKMDATHYLETDDIHIPTRRVLECKGSSFDFSDGKDITTLVIDNAVTAPSDGFIYLTKGNRKITLFQDTKFFKYVQIFSPDDSTAIAIEPVTAGANAFNCPELGLITLEPNERIDTFASVRVE